MTMTSPSASRRDVLKWLIGLPFLPLGAMTSGCAHNPALSTAQISGMRLKQATFSAMQAPIHVAEMAKTQVNSRLKIIWEDNSSDDYQLGYHELLRTGTLVEHLDGGKIVAGGYFDAQGKPILDDTRQYFSDCPDGSSLIALQNAQVPGVKHPVFFVVQFEYTSKSLNGEDPYGILPSPIAILTLDQDPQTGKLEFKKYFNVDTVPVHGLWITCGASLSPWNTHLSSEEYEPDAFDQGLGQSLKTLRGFGQKFFADAHKAKAYNYGHLPEVVVHPDGHASIQKHFCLGRISHELVQVMPDQRTVLMGDDYTNGGLFMFIADRERDLSAGTLYVAKYTQVLNEHSTARLRWIELGHARSRDIETLVNQDNIQPWDIMESYLDTDPGKPADLTSYTPIVLNKKKAWVKLKSGQEKAAAFLETHRYAAMRGGSLGFTKMEGTTVNIRDKVAYSALANIQDCMVKDDPCWQKELNISFSRPIKAGGILAHDLTGGQRTTDNQPIHSEWVPYQSKVLLLGEDIAKDALGNTAHPDKIASPDNLKFSETLRTLFIGEDSSQHTNNFLWAYQVDTGSLTRILSTPAGAESTGLHAVDSIHGWTYIMSNFQHPGDNDKLPAELKAQVLANYNQGYSASVGYLTADRIMPSVEKKN